MAPPDDWNDGQAHEEGHIAVVRRVGWTAGAKSLTGCPAGGRPSGGDADVPAPHQPSTRVRTG